jgi:predicted nucleotidyltransferase component of viral defense system
MDLLAKHEQFEMDVLYHLNSGRILEKIVFGGETMLRLCYELNRYSADLDFWLIKTVDIETFQNKITAHLADEYEITDSQIKHFSLLVEVRTPAYPRRLKIEIRKDIREWDLEKSIAFSKYSNRQVLLYTHTLSQTMDNKIAALITRGEIRDAFDIEFLLRKGITLPEMTMEDKSLLKKCLKSFRENDFKVNLGSILDEEMRSYYIKNHFRYLEEKL